MASKKRLTLTIVIPVYNEESHLKTCLDSIVKQSIAPDEIIVVDNNSTDGTAKIAKSYPSVKLLTESRQGRVFARNKGFNNSKSDLLARIDADTILPENWCQTVYSLAKKFGPDTAVTGPCYFTAPLGTSVWFWAHRVVYFLGSRLLFGHHVLFGSNMFIYKSTWDKVKNVVCLRNDIHEDMDLAYHVVHSGGKVEFVSGFRATISARRMLKPWLYPYMWLMTRLVH